MPGTPRARYVNAMREQDVLHAPLAPPAACSRCQRPLEPEKRHWGTCYACGREYGHALGEVRACTYAAEATRAWNVLLAAKFGEEGGYTADTVRSCQGAVAAGLWATTQVSLAS